jgi:hypothetical protein
MNIFISFDWDDRSQVNGFRSMLANPNVQPLTHRDTSIKHDYSEYGNNEIKRQIERKINESDIVVCLISQKTKHSEWVNWELERSRQNNKSIIGIVLKDQPVKTLAGSPQFFTRYDHFKVHTWGTPFEINKLINRALNSQFSSHF